MKTMSSEIRILLIDDHSLFRESLSRLLQTESDFQIAGTCASASEALALPHLDKVDVVLLDYDLGHEQGTLFLDRARSAGFAGRILMVTAGSSQTSPAKTLRIASTSRLGGLCFRKTPEEPFSSMRSITESLMPAVTIKMRPGNPALCALSRNRVPCSGPRS